MAIVKAGSAELLARLGFFIQRGFLDPEFCAQLRAEIAAAPQAGALLVDEQGNELLDESYRKVKEAKVSAASAARVEAKMLALKPELERHFRLRLQGCETLKFLSYKEGGFYKTHCDQAEDGGSSAAVLRARKVSLVVFLNAQAERPGADAYTGGALAFYGLVDDSPGERRGLPLAGESGLLVAFPSQVPHEVLPVGGGERFSIVSWIY